MKCILTHFDLPLIHLAHRLASVQEQRSSASTSSPTSGVNTSSSTGHPSSHHGSNVIEKSASVAVDSSDKNSRVSNTDVHF